jgi:hypothetical protein
VAISTSIFGIFEEEWIFFVCHEVNTDRKILAASYPTGTGSYFAVGKAARAQR